jgi:flagellar hook-associated protein 3 FlgL
MKVSTIRFFDQGNARLQETNVRLADLQRKISTGEKINRPSDGPESMARIHRMEALQTRQETYARSIDLANRRLSLQETNLKGVSDTLLAIRELVISGSTATLTQPDRDAKAVEIAGLIEGLIDIANARDEFGSHIFGGSATREPPFIRQSRLAPPQPQVTQLGSTGFTGRDVLLNNGQPLQMAFTTGGITRLVEVNAQSPGGLTPRGLAIAINDAGLGYSARIVDDGPGLLDSDRYRLVVTGRPGEEQSFTVDFRNVDFSNPAQVTEIATSAPEATPAVVAFDTLDAGQPRFQPGERLLLRVDTQTPVEVVLSDPGDGQVTAASMAADLNIALNLAFSTGDVVYAAPDPLQPSRLQLQSATSGLGSFLAVERLDNFQTVNGALAPVSLQEATGERVITEGRVLYQGDSGAISVQVGDGRSVRMTRPGIETFLAVPDPLNPGRAIDFFAVLDRTVSALRSNDTPAMRSGIDTIDEILQGISVTRAEIGTAQRVLDLQSEFLSMEQIRSVELLSNLRDLNFAEAISELRKEELILQAAQNTLARIANLSLFNYIQ